ncbi:MAG: hypothetical protein ACE5J0_02855 [Candidatus Paceibacterales bacterium]
MNETKFRERLEKEEYEKKKTPIHILLVEGKHTYGLIRSVEENFVKIEGFTGAFSIGFGALDIVRTARLKKSKLSFSKLLFVDEISDEKLKKKFKEMFSLRKKEKEQKQEVIH